MAEIVVLRVGFFILGKSRWAPRHSQEGALLREIVVLSFDVFIIGKFRWAHRDPREGGLRGLGVVRLRSSQRRRTPRDLPVFASGSPGVGTTYTEKVRSRETARETAGKGLNHLAPIDHTLLE